MKKFTALHLSDLHLSRAHAQLQQRAVRALCRELTDYRDAGHLIDAIFFTGELIAAAGAADTPPSYVYQQLIQPLLAAASMPGARFYLVPRKQGRAGAGVDAFAEAGFSFFSTPERADAEQRAVYQNVHAVFHRHKRAGDDNALMQALGALFDSRCAAPADAGGGVDGYAILEFTGAPAPHWAVTRRRYDDAQQAFLLETSKPGAADAPPAAPKQAARHARFDRQLLSHALSGIAPKSLLSMFVEPPISNLSGQQDAEDGAAFQARSLAELAANSKAVFFVGRDESGKSTVLNYLCLQARTPYAFQVDLTSAAAGDRAALLAAVARSGGVDAAAVGAMLRQTGTLVCFDNLSLEHAGTLAALAAFMAEFSACKFMFSLGEGCESGLERAFLSRLAIEADVVYLHSYGARHIRQLAGNWFGDALDAVMPRLDEMVRGAARADIAPTPLLVSMLLCMAEKNLPFPALNRAEVIAWFTNGLLGTAPGVALRRDFLIEASYFLFESKKLSLTSAQWRQFAADYLGVKGAQMQAAAHAVALLAELCAQGLLAEEDGQIGFAFDCYRTFFLAQKFDTSIDLMRYAFTQQGFLELRSELDIYTGLHQDAIEVLTASDRLPDADAKPVVTAPYFPDLGRYEDRFHGGWLDLQQNDAVDRREPLGASLAQARVAGGVRNDTQTS